LSQQAIIDSQQHRIRFVDRLVESGSIRSEHVKQALLSVERHRFVKEWFTLGMSEGVPAWTRIVVGPDGFTPDQLEMIYSDLALVTAVDQLIPTGSLSAPPLVAEMLEDLDLSESMCVLEIGTCSGYNAALLAEIVSTEGNVYTIENRAEAARLAIETLRELGYDQVHACTKDGFFGHSPGAPYDRIIATTGCSDLPSHWIDQMSQQGRVLLPLQYGHADFLVAASPETSYPVRAKGRVIGKAHFMAVQGALSWVNPWTGWDLPGVRSDTLSEEPLPEGLPAVSNPSHPLYDSAHTDFYFFLTLASRELWYDNKGYGIVDPMTGVKVLVEGDKLTVYGPPSAKEDGGRLTQRLIRIYNAWESLNRPRLSDYTLRFISKQLASSAPFKLPEHYWTIERVCHLELVSL